MKRLRSKNDRAEPLRHAAVDAARGALSGDAGTSSDKRALTGARAVATGAVLYTVGRAAFDAGRFVRARRALKQDATVASSNPTRPRPERRPAQENAPQPSLRLPNRRWSRMAAERK